MKQVYTRFACIEVILCAEANARTSRVGIQGFARDGLVILGVCNTAITCFNAVVIDPHSISVIKNKRLHIKRVRKIPSLSQAVCSVFSFCGKVIPYRRDVTNIIAIAFYGGERLFLYQGSEGRYVLYAVRLYI